MSAKPGEEINVYKPDEPLYRLAAQWVRSSARQFPNTIMQSDEHEFELFTNTVEAMQADPKFV